MTKSKRIITVISGMVLVFTLVVGGYISVAQSKTSMVGLVSFNTESNAVVGNIISANRGMQKIITYQIPPLTGEGPTYTFHAPYIVAITPDKDSNGDDNGGEDNNGEQSAADTIMDDEDDNGHMRGALSHMHWKLDTYITLANTSDEADPVTVHATFYDNSGDVLLEDYKFTLGRHQTIQESVFKILGLR
jgi:hypothetical protein